MKISKKLLVTLSLTLTLLLSSILCFTACTPPPKLPTDEELLAMESDECAKALMDAAEIRLDRADSFTSKNVSKVALRED